MTRLTVLYSHSQPVTQVNSIHYTIQPPPFSFSTHHQPADHRSSSSSSRLPPVSRPCFHKALTAGRWAMARTAQLKQASRRLDKANSESKESRMSQPTTPTSVTAITSQLQAPEAATEDRECKGEPNRHPSKAVPRPSMSETVSVSTTAVDQRQACLTQTGKQITMPAIHTIRMASLQPGHSRVPGRPVTSGHSVSHSSTNCIVTLSVNS